MYVVEPPLHLDSSPTVSIVYGNDTVISCLTAPPITRVIIPFYAEQQRLKVEATDLLSAHGNSRCCFS